MLRGELSEDNEPWRGHQQHEIVFILPDICLAFTLFASVIFQGAAADTIRLMAAGALVFLGLLDLTYLAQTWRLRSSQMRMRTMLVGSIALGAGLFLGISS